MEFDSLVIYGAGYFAYSSVGLPIHQEDCGNLAVSLSHPGIKDRCCFRLALVDWEHQPRQSKCEGQLIGNLAPAGEFFSVVKGNRFEEVPREFPKPLT